jgi:hypothetical protein
VVVAAGLLPFGIALGLRPHAPALPSLAVIGLLAGLPAAALVAAPAAVMREGDRATGMDVFYTWYYAGMSFLPPVAGWLQDALGGWRSVGAGAPGPVSWTS